MVFLGTARVSIPSWESTCRYIESHRWMGMFEPCNLTKIHDSQHWRPRFRSDFHLILTTQVQKQVEPNKCEKIKIRAP